MAIGQGRALKSLPDLQSLRPQAELSARTAGLEKSPHAPCTDARVLQTWPCTTGQVSHWAPHSSEKPNGGTSRLPGHSLTRHPSVQERVLGELAGSHSLEGQQSFLVRARGQHG